MRIPGARYWLWLVVSALMPGCGGKIEPDVTSGGDGGEDEPSLPAGCEDEPIPARSLECAGLYSSVEDKTIAKNAREFAPAIPLWSDGLEKHRWIVLPKGTTIDASNPEEWEFPAGTKFFKEFRSEGKRLETRLFQKKDNGLWVHNSYAWNDDETEAPSGMGKFVPKPDGDDHQIPPDAQCEQCHKGRGDPVLGFEAVSLGLEGAKGVTLADLVKEKLLDPAPESVRLEIGDDGTGLAAPALGWMHINCGVTCHNDNSNSTAYSAGMILRLNPEHLDGRSSREFPSRTTTMGVKAENPNWNGETRIVTGNPGASLLAELIGRRVAINAENNGQMPPIATNIVDRENVDRVVAWIEAMGERE